MAAANMKRHGNVMVPEAREITTWPVSSGCRRVSRAARRNSGNSSRKRTPLCARDTSPGVMLAPPPISPTSEMVWWGARNGRWSTMPFPRFSKPHTEWILLVSSASSGLRGGRMVGSLLRQHGFAGPRRAAKQDIMAACRRNLHGAACIRLPLDFVKIHSGVFVPCSVDLSP